MAVSAHENPDGDAIGSALGFYLFLKKKGLKSVPVCVTPVPQRYDFLPGFSDFTREIPRETSLLVIIDAPDAGRLGVNWEGPAVRIDHHEEGLVNDLTIQDTAAASTGSILLDFIRAWDQSAVDADIATCLYTAILTDTNSFNIRTDSGVFQDAAWLVQKGVDPVRVAGFVYRRRTEAYMRLLGRALSRLSFEMDGAFAFMVLRREDFQATGARGHEAENLVEFPFSVEGVMIAAKVQQDRDRWRISLRSKDPFSAERIAKAFGGGGHMNAAGAVVSGELSDVIVRLRAEVKKELGI
ncbi:MAG: bifunctional oligoribonuclease/PAP phosphatase NrnA [candidate division WOR-3 bacterium]